MLVLTHGNIAYFPITKNASTTFTDHFANQGWQTNQFDLLDDSYEIFAHFQNPIERHFKGTVEFLCQNGIDHLVDDPVWQKVWSKSVMDLHSYPVTWMVGNRKINWILIRENIDTIGLTRDWLRERNIDLGNVEWKNRSNQKKNKFIKNCSIYTKTLKTKIEH